MSEHSGPGEQTNAFYLRRLPSTPSTVSTTGDWQSQDPGAAAPVVGAKACCTGTQRSLCRICTSSGEWPSFFITFSIMRHNWSAPMLVSA